MAVRIVPHTFICHPGCLQGWSLYTTLMLALFMREDVRMRHVRNRQSNRLQQRSTDDMPKLEMQKHLFWRREFKLKL